MQKFIFISFTVTAFLLIDWYIFQVVKNLSTSRWVHQLFWAVTALTVLAYCVYHLAPHEFLSSNVRRAIMIVIFINYFSKVLMTVFILIDDLIRLGKWLISKITASNNPIGTGEAITRSQFLMKTAAAAGVIPVATMTWGILSGAHDYRIRRHTVLIKNLPKAFDGIRIVQLSDIHSGSFFNKTAVKGGVEMAMKEKPDMVFFTGDLVNNTADEVQDYIPIFGKLKAPLGVYSTLGNHDYGDYVQWDSKEAKRKNLQRLIEAHKTMGWNILMDEHRLLEENHEKLAIIGIQNWGAGERWPKYGNLKKAHAGTEEAATKLLLSHDPSHWDAQVTPNFADIDLMFAGHTHGFQFGIETEYFKWSPSQYVYKQWAGLYESGEQKLYVNRGFGYLGYPGRVGILPEITVMELKRG